MKLFTKILLAAALMVVFGFSISNPHKNVKINASEIVDRHLTGFHAVNVAGSFDVYITQGSAESVKVEAPSDVMGHIITEVNNGVLKIYNKHDTWHWGDFWGNHKKIVVYVTAKNLDDVNLSGSGDVYFKDGISANSLKLNVSGSGDMLGRVEVKTLESSISGSGDMKLSGHAGSSTVSVVGSGDYTARNLLTVSTSVRVAGSGDADINASDRIDAAVSGSGDVRYSGSVRTINSRKSGSGDISRF